MACRNEDVQHWFAAAVAALSQSLDDPKLMAMIEMIFSDVVYRPGKDRLH